MGMFGLPSYNEVGPTVLVGVTHTIMFGIMFADLEQRLCVSLVGLFVWKKSRMQLGKTLTPRDTPSAIFGFIFGSVSDFKHALNPIYHVLSGLEDKLIEVMHPATTNVIIYLAVGVGASFVMIVILINIYSNIKKKKYDDALFSPNGLAGLLFYGSITIGSGGQIMMGW